MVLKALKLTVLNNFASITQMKSCNNISTRYEHIFKMEQEEYAKEEIDWSYIEFFDNQDVLDLIDKKPGGIIALLDEACMFPKSNHETFSEKLYQSFKNHKRFIKPKLTRSDFTIVHYAGDVQYQSDQFLDKNKDYVVPEHQELLNASKCSFVAGLFSHFPEETAKPSKFSSIGSRFKLQLQQLMETISSTEPHYIRCVKPNNLLKPAIFENSTVMQQLRSGGVLEAVRIKCAGYPTHKTFFEFLTRFGILAPEVLEGDFEEKVACEKIQEKMGLDGYLIGKSKIFLRAGQMAELDAQRTRIHGNSAIAIQKCIRARIARKNFIAMRNACIRIQSYWRCVLTRESYEIVRREVAAVKIQKNTRRNLVRKAHIKMRFSTVVLQAGLRAMAARSEYRRRRHIRAAIVIQTYWCQHRTLSDYKSSKNASTISQSRLSTSASGEDLGKDGMTDLVEEDLLVLPCSLHDISTEFIGETIEMIAKESHSPKEIEEAYFTIKEPSSPVKDAEKVETLRSEVADLKAMLQVERQRANEYEKKYAEAKKSSEYRRKKLEESERKVHQLQDSINRMIHSMSNQISELRMIVKTSTSSDATTRFIQNDIKIDTISGNCDSSSSDSDFSFPVPNTSTSNFSSFSPNSFQLIVQDISAADIRGSDSDKESGFSDYF